MARRGAGARGCGRVLGGGVGAGWSGVERRRRVGGLVMRVREVARWRVMWFYFQLQAMTM